MTLEEFVVGSLGVKIPKNKDIVFSVEENETAHDQLCDFLEIDTDHDISIDRFKKNYRVTFKNICSFARDSFDVDSFACDFVLELAIISGDMTFHNTGTYKFDIHNLMVVYDQETVGRDFDEITRLNRENTDSVKPIKKNRHIKTVGLPIHIHEFEWMPIGQHIVFTNLIMDIVPSIQYKKHFITIDKCQIKNSGLGKPLLMKSNKGDVRGKTAPLYKFIDCEILVNDTTITTLYGFHINTTVSYSKIRYVDIEDKTKIINGENRLRNLIVKSVKNHSQELKLYNVPKGTTIEAIKSNVRSDCQLIDTIINCKKLVSGELNDDMESPRIEGNSIIDCVDLVGFDIDKTVKVVCEKMSSCFVRTCKEDYRYGVSLNADQYNNKDFWKMFDKIDDLFNLLRLLGMVSIIEERELQQEHIDLVCSEYAIPVPDEVWWSFY